MKKKNIKDKEIIIIFSNQKGMALLTTLIFVFILVTFAVALLTMTSNDTKLSTLQRDSTKAFYLAETGIDKALWYLNTSIDNGGEGLDWPTDDGVKITEGTSEEYYEVIVKYEPIGQNEIISIVSTGVVKEGTYSSGKRKIKVIAKKAISPSYSLAYNYAIFADLILTINGNITINGDIHANESIGGSNNNPTINGEQTIGGDEDYPFIDFDYYKQLAIENGTYYGDNTSKFFNIDETITGIHFIDGDVDIHANLNISDGAIFATGNIKSYGNSVITHTKSANYTNPLALVAKGDITILGTVSTEGVIQSKNDIKVSGTVDVKKGALFANNVRVDGDVTVTYDPELLGQTVVGTGVEIYKKISWQELY